MTIFGWIYLLLTILAGVVTVNEIGNPRKPITPAEAASKLLFTGLLFWALYVWGLHA